MVWEVVYAHSDHTSKVLERKIVSFVGTVSLKQQKQQTAVITIMGPSHKSQAWMSKVLEAKATTLKSNDTRAVIMSRPKWLHDSFDGCNSMKLNYNICGCSLNSWAALWVKQLEEYCLYHTLTEMHNRKLGCQVCEGIRNKQWLEQLEQKRAHTHTLAGRLCSPASATSVGLPGQILSLKSEGSSQGLSAHWEGGTIMWGTRSQPHHITVDDTAVVTGQSERKTNKGPSLQTRSAQHERDI